MLVVISGFVQPTNIAKLTQIAILPGYFVLSNDMENEIMPSFNFQTIKYIHQMPADWMQQAFDVKY